MAEIVRMPKNHHTKDVLTETCRRDIELQQQLDVARPRFRHPRRCTAVGECIYKLQTLAPSPQYSSTNRTAFHVICFPPNSDAAWGGVRITIADSANHSDNRPTIIPTIIMFTRFSAAASRSGRSTLFIRALYLALAHDAFLRASAQPFGAPNRSSIDRPFRLAVGAIIGIVVGIVVFWALVGFLIFVIIRRRRARRNVPLMAFPGGGTGFNSGPSMAHTNHMHGMHHSTAPPPPPDGNVTGANFSSGPAYQPTNY
ncbi:hypothetical protein PC9H_006953 [Pleurotus ostreatus]|uniref:Uncharacterized protein n=1 Tax=Pleurotus ostreatus TaxID=5322 RepID=A0A8H6ZYW1_PLEOS|nr:uncharacterized protein PC9H_006953 [Pleurotus ostreatus]KAF7431232.1 hypothetical protein PC9H_006953 [Pleurotus ostreatus]